jgi:prepilin-type processing-associated H-X9-DG protein
METLADVLSEQTTQRIGWTLLHFLWQGTVVMALTWCVLKILHKTSSNTRYTAACIALALMVLAPIITFAVLNRDSTPPPVFEPAAAPREAPVSQPPVQTQTLVIAIEKPAPPQQSPFEILTARIEAALPGCVTGWLVGVTALSLWYLGGWCQLQRLRRIGTKTVPVALTETTAQLARCLGIQRAVRIVESALVQVPTVIGHLKPIILLPATALTGLDELQLKAMIAHELAHIRRCDYAVNIAQTVVEILGFYHPAVWWISRRIRIERENACDDAAIELLQSRKQYANALFSMEAIRAKQHTLALAATGAPLTHRIQRIAGKQTTNPASGWIPSVAAALILLILIVSVSLAAKQDPPTDPAAAMMDKQKIAAFFKDFEQALQNDNRQTVEQSLYFENDALRQKAQPYITDMLDDNITLLTGFRIIRVDLLANNSLSVFGLYPVQGKMYVTNTLPVKIENGRYQLDLFNADFFKKIEIAKTQTPHQIGRNAMQEQLDEWQSADSEALNTLIQTLINGEENNLAAAQYAQANDLQMMPHFTIPEITRRLARYKTTDPEQLRREFVEELTAQLQDNNKTQPSSSKASKKAAQTDNQSSLEILNTELEPVAQGKNVLYATVKNTSDTEQLFAIHIQTRSVDYGPEGIGWGTPFFETLQPGETKRARFVYKIQGPVTDNTYIRVKYFNPATEDDYGATEPFAMRLYEGSDQKKRTAAEEATPASQAQFEELSAAFNTMQDLIRNRQYPDAWELFSEDYKKCEYQARGFDAFQKQMEPTHPTYSAFLWEKEDFLKLKPLKAFTDNGTLKLQAACDDAQWTIDFIKEDNRWKINWIAGYRPAVLEMQADQNARLESANHLRQLGLAHFMFRDDHDGNAPAGLEDLQPYLDNETWQWVNKNKNMVLLPVKKDLTPTETATTAIAYDKTLLQTQNGATVVFADGHVEYMETEKLEELGISVKTEKANLKELLKQARKEVVEHNRARAIEIYRQAVDLDPNSVDANLNLAWLLHMYKKGQFANGKAIISPTPINEIAPYFEKVLELDPQNGSAMAGLGEIAQENGDIEKAINLYKKNIEVSGNAADAPMLRLATIYREKGEYHTAVKYYDMFLKIHPDAENAKEKRDYCVKMIGESVSSESQTENSNSALVSQPSGPSHILTTGYLVSVPKDMPELNGIIPKGQSNSEMISPEKLETFLAAVRQSPDAQLLARPSLLTHDNQASGVRIDNPDDDGYLKLNVTNHIAPDRQTIRMEVEFELARPLGTGLSTNSIVTMATMQSGHAVAISGDVSGNTTTLLLLQARIPDPAAPANDTPITVPPTGGLGGGVYWIDPQDGPAEDPGLGGGMGGFVGSAPPTDQIAIETRFLLVTDWFLEDLGIDDSDTAGQVIAGLANSDDIRAAQEPKPLSEKTSPLDDFQVLDDKQTSMLIRAAQAHRDAKTLTAPKVVVLNGEAADLRVQTPVRYMDIDDQEKDVNKGVSLDLLPIIQQDAKEVLLRGHIRYFDILENRSVEHQGKTYDIPYVQVANTPVLALIKNEKTLLIVGPELTTTEEITEHITSTRPHDYQPRSTNKQRILILIKPTIIEQQEQQTPAVGVLATEPSGGMMGGGFGGGMKEEDAN